MEIMSTTSTDKFNEWMSANYNRLIKQLANKYPKCRATIHSDVVDAYELIVSKNPMTILNWEAWIYQFVYNRHYKFFKKHKLNDTVNVEQLEIESCQYDEERDNQLTQLQQIVKDLPIDYQNLYQLHYVEGLSGREIAKRLNLHYTGIYKQINRLKATISKKF